MIYNFGYIMEITKTLVLISLAVIKATNTLRCYTGMTQNRMPVPDQNAKIEDCSSSSCVTMKYLANVTGDYLPVAQAMCIPDGGATCNSLCAVMEQNQPVGASIKNCTAKCCETDMCNDEINRSTVTPIECYTGMTHNGNPVPNMQVNQTSCPSGECADLQYSLTVMGIDIKVNQAMCAYPGHSCTKLCEQVATHQNITDCKANCCKTVLCNNAIVGGSKTTKLPEISTVSSTVKIAATSTPETTSSPQQNTKETTTPKSGAKTLPVFRLTIFIVFLKSFIDFMF